jgi:hypothetical protein
VAVIDTGLKTHPTFTGLDVTNRVFLSDGSTNANFRDDSSTAQDLHGHGTHVAGIVAGRGSAECVGCRGVARGLTSLYNVKAGYLTSTGGGSFSSLDVSAALDWLAQSTAVRIINFSAGGDEVGIDDTFSRTFDRYADTYGFAIAVSAGNDGPGTGTVGSPSVGYNVTSVANWVSRGTIASSSSRGTSNGGRFKPDIAAPGTSINSARHTWDSPGVSDYVSFDGTSMAAPHIAGAYALLRQAGVTDPIAAKAILINTSDNPTTVFDWQADRGWGYANLTRAQSQLFHRTGNLVARGTPGYYHLYRVRSASRIYSTLTWNRHFSGNTSVFHDIDLAMYDTASGAQLDFSDTAIQNVEVVDSNVADAVVKVLMFSTALAGGLTSERYAVAFSTGDITLMNPPGLTLVCTPPSGAVAPGATFSLPCQATNTGTLAAFGTSGQVVLPTGFAGSNGLSYGNIQPGGSPQVTLSLTAPTAANTYGFSASVSSTSFGETITASTTFNVVVGSGGPGVPANPSPANGGTGVSLSPTLAWTGGSGATSHDVYFGTSSNPPFVANTTGTSYSPGALASGTTYFWRIVARNASGTTTSATWSFTTLASISVTVTTNPAGLSVVVDGTTATAPQTFNWTPGSVHSISVVSPQGSGATRQVFSSWSDGGAITHNVTTPSTATTYTAQFTTQHRLTTSASPSVGGSVVASPSSSDGYYAAGTSVSITASPATGYVFTGFSGDLSGSANPQSVTMSAPRTVTANFSALTGVTVATVPSGLLIVVDGVTATAPQTYNWTPGTVHSLSLVSPQGSGGTRRMFASWSDGGALTHNVTAPSSPTTYTATLDTLYLLSTAVTPSGGGSVAASPPSSDGFYAAGSNVAVTATANTGFVFTGFSGDLSGSANPQSITMSAPRSVTAGFTAVTAITVATNPAGLQIVVDGVTATAPQSYNWVPGSVHSISTLSPQGSGGTRFVFANWSDGGGQTHSVTAPSTATTYTATFATQHLLTLLASPSGGGNVSANPPSGDGYYSAGVSVQVTAAANAGFAFAGFSGDLAGSANPQSITMSAPRSVTGNFSALTGITVTTNPAGLQIVVDGVTATAPQSYNWVPGSVHSIGTTSPQGSGGTRFVFANWSDSGAQTHGVTAPSTATTYTATFATQHLLTLLASPSGGGDGVGQSILGRRLLLGGGQRPGDRRRQRRVRVLGIRGRPRGSRQSAVDHHVGAKVGDRQLLRTDRDHGRDQPRRAPDRGGRRHSHGPTILQLGAGLGPLDLDALSPGFRRHAIPVRQLVRLRGADTQRHRPLHRCHLHSHLHHATPAHPAGIAVGGGDCVCQSTVRRRLLLGRRQRPGDGRRQRRVRIRGIHG